jgi:hypothetical protein
VVGFCVAVVLVGLVGLVVVVFGFLVVVVVVGLGFFVVIGFLVEAGLLSRFAATGAGTGCLNWVPSAESCDGGWGSLSSCC